MHKRTVTLREIPGKGWLWLEHGRMYKSLAGAIRAQDREDKRLARTFGAVARLVTYEPVTTIGELVVKTLIAQSDER